MKKYILKFKGLFSITCFFQLVISAIGVGCAFVLQYIVDLATGGDMNKFTKGIFFFVAYCALSFIIDLLLVIFKTVYTKKTMVYPMSSGSNTPIFYKLEIRAVTTLDKFF